jgi:FtsP/CotA-like multicopper oxidase with cupredoxin domain
MKTRRELLKVGAAALTVPSIFGGTLFSGSAQAQLCRSSGIRTPGTEPDSPPVTAYSEPLFIPDALRPIDPASLAPQPLPSHHQRFEEFTPLKFYQQRITEGVWNYHTQLSALTPAQAGAAAGTGSLAWLYNGSTPGETLVARYGEPIFVRRYNDLPTADEVEMPIGYPAITTHLHNAHTASESDGYPMDFAVPGQHWDHHYAMMYARNNPREALASLWYHDHMVDFTATNVYAGLSGMAIFYDHLDTGNENDRHRRALRLPGNMRFGGNPGYANGYDISLILHDVRFDEQGNPAYNVFDLDGHLGDLITVNRKVMPFLHVERRKYRFRIYDGGPSRFYELGLSDESPFFIITNDGNLLEEPVAATSMVLGPANRQDVIIDFSRYSPGQTVEMLNIMEQINGQGPSGRRLEGPERMPVMQFRVIDSNVEDNSRIPDFLRRLPRINLKDVVAEREWVFDHDMGLWSINGSFMDPTVVSAAPKQGTAEIWHFRNAGSSWAHPCHVHFEEFQVLEWNGKKPTGILQSRKDVATLGPNDHVKVFYRFDDFVGRYVIHCHNNVHEDNAMMLRWDITQG